MLYCPKCGIHILGRKSRCPLCQGALTGTPEESVFPNTERKGVTGKLATRIATFALITVEIVMIATGYLSDTEAGRPLFWIPLVMIGAVVVWINFILALRYRNNVIKIITIEAYLAMIIDYIVDWNTGFYGWSVNWMIPVTFVGITVATIAVARAVKMDIADYALYLQVDALLCLIQILPLLLHQIHFTWPAVISIAFNLVIISGAYIFRKREMKNAAAKYFHV